MPADKEGILTPHAASPEALLAQLRTDPQSGLSDAEAAERLKAHGPNSLPEPPPQSELLRFLRQFTSPLVLVLLAAAVVATIVGFTQKGEQTSLLGRFADALAIVSIVLLNAVLGYVQERRAETALAALRRLSVPNARVLRGGELQQIAADSLVPGDLIALEAGDAVPADARLLRSSNVSIDESTLTGESAPVTKDALRALPAETALADQSTMVFLGTTLVRGTAQALVVHTGADTELGKIGTLLAGVAEQDAPLEQNLERFGKQILWLCLVASAILLGWGFLRGGRPWHLLLLEAVSFAVAAIPEGLPAITTIALALGTQRMARRGVIIRRLAAVESLGALNVICTDKTGTLTQNQMTVRAIYAGGMRYQVTGEGYAPKGGLLTETGEAIASGALPEPAQALLRSGALCNNAQLTPNEQDWRMVGDPTEGALLTVAGKGGIQQAEVMAAYPRLRELPFDSDRKRMTVVVRAADGSTMAHVKGSLDGLLPLCDQILAPEGSRPLLDSDRAAILAEAERMAKAALRVLALAERSNPPDGSEEQALTFLGLVGMLDPPRSGVREAIATCREAGIAVVMITGDHAGTAQAIAEEIGLSRPGDEVLTGADLAHLDENELRARVPRVRIFARTTAEQKLRIVRAFKSIGQIVAMTGDGVNDAPALREAHVGVAMGKGGTDVARQAAGVVITDDNFATIVSGVREGRAIYRNIQKFIYYLLSSNAALTLAVFVAAFHPHCLPLTPLMILCINLVTNGLPALALGVDPPDTDQMKEPPRSAAAGLFHLYDYLGIAFAGLAMGVPAVALYYWPWHATPITPEWSRAMAFAVLGFGPLFHAWNCRSPELSLFVQRPIIRWTLVGACLLSAGIHLVSAALPGLRAVFHTYPLALTDWFIIVALSAVNIPAVEVAKAIGRKLGRGHAEQPTSR